MTEKSKHPNSILGLDAKTISEKLTDLRFDYMADLFGHFNDHLRKMMEEDKLKGREKLAMELQIACSHISSAADCFDNAWEISKNKTDNEDFDLFEDLIEK